MPTPDFSKIWASASPLPEFTFTDAEYTEGWDFVGSAPPTKNQFDAWFKMVDEKLNWLYNQMQETASKLYPVGSVYISFNSEDPSTLFGGTWVRLKDTFLLANGDSYAPNITGGSATKNITVDNLPSHSHTISWDGNHSHVRGTMNITGTFGDITAGDGTGSATGAFYYEPSASYNKYDPATPANIYGFGFNAALNWFGETSLNGYHSHAIGNTGSSLPLNIMPPYRTVYMWRRKA